MFSLIVLSLMLVSVLSLSAVSVSEKKSSFSTEQSSRAFQVADSGVEFVLKKIYKEYKGGIKPQHRLADFFTCSGGVVTKTFSSGTAMISFYDGSGGVLSCTDNDWRIKVARVKSVGSANNTTRVVEAGVAPPDDTVGHWEFDETSGSATIDSSESGNNGSWGGSNVGFTTRTRTSPASPGNAFSFAGTNGGGSINLEDDNDAGAFNFESDITGSAWIRTSTNGRGILQYQHGTPLIYMQVGATTAGGNANKFVIYLRTESNNLNVVSSDAVVTDGTWRFVAFTRNIADAKIRLYINGVLDKEVPISATDKQKIDTASGSGNHFIGDITNGGNYEFNGAIDDVRVYNRALSTAEILALYNATK